jgi:hypothetical protein
VEYDNPAGATAIDIVLVRHDMGATKGWEVILPRFSSMGFWLALVYDGARVVGVDDMRGLAREARVPYFPDDYPDTEAGRAWEGRAWSLRLVPHLFSTYLLD